MKAEEAFAGLTGFQQALTGHVHWLRHWYQAILHRPESGAIFDAQAETCPFDHWLGGPAGAPLDDFSGFATMACEHHDVHERAAQISARVAAGQPVTSSDYEALMGAILAFGGAAQTLEREVWKTLATVDPLTGLANRRTMHQRLLGERDRALRQNQPLCVALADIDHFKKINDTHGHARGDTILREVAQVLRNFVRPYDEVFRYGGEEFLICLPGTCPTTAQTVLERIRQAIQAQCGITDEGAATLVTATFGVSEVTASTSVEDAIEHADRALYDGKRAGRNRVLLYDAA